MSSVPPQLRARPIQGPLGYKSTELFASEYRGMLILSPGIYNPSASTPKTTHARERIARMNLPSLPCTTCKPESENRLRGLGLGFFQPKGIRQQLVGAMARSGIVSPGDHDQLVEFQAFREFFKARGDLL